MSMLARTQIPTSLRLHTPPASEPMTVAEMWHQLRLIPTGSPLAHPDDALIAGLITAARQHLDGKDGWLGRQFITATYELVMDRFPTHEIQLPLPPLQAVTHVYYDDVHGDQRVWAADNYQVDTDSQPGWLLPVSGTSWPETIQGVNAVRIRFLAGYGEAASDVPEPIRLALKRLVTHWYQQREPVVVGAGVQSLPMDVEALLLPYRIWEF